MRAHLYRHATSNFAHWREKRQRADAIGDQADRLAGQQPIPQIGRQIGRRHHGAGRLTAARQAGDLSARVVDPQVDEAATAADGGQVRDLVVEITDFMNKLQSVKPWLIRGDDKAVSEGEYLQTPANAGFDDQDQCWVETSAQLAKNSAAELKKLGVTGAKASGATLKAEVSCWAEILPLDRDRAPADHLEQTPVLFDLASGDELARLVIEVLRLGNDRQGYRWLEEPDFWARHLHPDDEDMARDCHNETLAGRDHELEYRMVAADGRTVWLRDYVNVHCVDGVPAELFGVMVDITREHEAEQNFRRMVELSPDCIGVHVDGVYVYVNQAFVQLLGAKSEADIVGSSIFTFIDDAFHADVKQRLDQDRTGFRDLGAEFNLALTRHRADLESPVRHPNARELGDAVQVHDMVGQHETHVQHRHQRLTAGERLRVLERAHEFDSLRQRRPSRRGEPASLFTRHRFRPCR